MIPEDLGTYQTTQCYFSKQENDLDEKGQIRRIITRIDTTYTYYLHRRYSDNRPELYLPRPI